MYDPGYGLGIDPKLTPENQLRSAFLLVNKQNGVLLFNISAVDLNEANKGFTDYSEAERNNQITEWELHMILKDKQYLQRSRFHNGKVEFKKIELWKAIAV
jgi:hypothetical protein